MSWRAVIVFLAACSSRTSVSSDASFADSSPPDPDRPVSNLIVGANFTVWGHGELACSHDFGCRAAGPTVTAFNRAMDAVTTWVDGGVGTPQIAGTETELYFVNGDAPTAMSLRRIGGSGTGALSFPRPNVRGPAIDADAVYWAEGNSINGQYAVQKASRAGNGSDATTIAQSEYATEQLTCAAGHLWWIEGDTGWLTRVPVTGGVPQRVIAGVSAVAAEVDGVYVGRTLDAGGGARNSEIAFVSATGTHRAIATQPGMDLPPRYIVPDGNLIFWSAGDGDLYFAATAGSAAGMVTAEDKSGVVFAVLPDRYLVELTRHGFRTIQR